MYLLHNSPCIICRDKDRSSEKTKLQKIERLVEHLDETTDSRYELYSAFDVHSHCKYGLSCTELRTYDNKCRNIVDRIKNKVITATLMDDDKIYIQILQLCRGDFPIAYRTLEKIHHTRNKGDDK